MEFCAGKTLTAMMKGKAPVGTILRGMHDLALKVREIHQAGFAHNDLKPDNVILETSTDGAVRARMIDFGLCTRLGVSPGFEGKPEGHRHVAPELLRRGVATVESDTFSLGILLRLVLGTYASSFPEKDFELLHLAEAMICPDPHWRPRFQMCLEVLADNRDAPRRESGEEGL
ncbi:serine/threonine-protein kinase/endoribonuclease IRE1-like [Penaeus chinensis]|uniref:serine/threonine-protein kinase/endoribonuclease IRE1-like n=1 Tax=Penaeus chinensis TaxID=139456 RepID=UPI001FB7CC58|nr:serine/threonine-protein kinase/endoribonuclease IRE1-like [Penaeus chinensis]